MIIRTAKKIEIRPQGPPKGCFLLGGGGPDTPSIKQLQKDPLVYIVYILYIIYYIYELYTTLYIAHHIIYSIMCYTIWRRLNAKLWSAVRSIRMERNPVPYVWNAPLVHTLSCLACDRQMKLSALSKYNIIQYCII